MSHKEYVLHFSSISKANISTFFHADQRPSRTESRYDSLKSNNGELAKALGMKFLLLLFVFFQNQLNFKWLTFLILQSTGLVHLNMTKMD